MDADRREAFETWLRRHRPVADLSLKPDGQYRSQAVRNQLEAFEAGADWQAARPDGVTAAPSSEVQQAKRAGFMFGWKAAAVWANRDDLIADIGSPAYERDCDAACGVALSDHQVKAPSDVDESSPC